MVVLLKRKGESFILRVVGTSLTEWEGNKMLRSKDCGGHSEAVTLLDKAVARRIKSGWREEGRCHDVSSSRILLGLSEKMDTWRGLPDGTSNMAWVSGHIPASAEDLEQVKPLFTPPDSYRDFLQSTDGFVLRCRFEKNGYRNEQVATFLSTRQLSSLSEELRAAYPKVVKAGEIVVEVDWLDPHLTRPAELSGAILNPRTGRVTVWRFGTREAEHGDFREFFEAWLPRFNEYVHDAWGDVARR